MTGLVYRERLAQGDAAGLLVLHHGRGADEQDLLPLADVLDPQRRVHVVAPRAPLRLPGGPGYHWYLVPRVGYPDPDTFHAAYRKLEDQLPVTDQSIYNKLQHVELPVSAALVLTLAWIATCTIPPSRQRSSGTAPGGR